MTQVDLLMSLGISVSETNKMRTDEFELLQDIYLERKKQMEQLKGQ